MNRPKKIWYIVAFVVAALIGSVILWCVKNAQNTNQLKHKSITGTILSYEQAPDGLTFLIDDDATSSDKEVVITQDTMFKDELLKQSIFDLETGSYVTVESEFWTQTYNGIYPAIMISPAT